MHPRGVHASGRAPSDGVSEAPPPGSWPALERPRRSARTRAAAKAAEPEGCAVPLTGPEALRGDGRRPAGHGHRHGGRRGRGRGDRRRGRGRGRGDRRWGRGRGRGDRRRRLVRVGPERVGRGRSGTGIRVERVRGRDRSRQRPRGQARARPRRPFPAAATDPDPGSPGPQPVSGLHCKP